MTDIEMQIRKMIVEMKSGHNDGYVTDHYRKMLTNLKTIIDDALKD